MDKEEDKRDRETGPEPEETNNVDEKPSNGEEASNNIDEKPSNGEEASNNTDEKPSNGEEASNNIDEKPSNGEEAASDDDMDARPTSSPLRPVVCQSSFFPSSTTRGEVAEVTVHARRDDDSYFMRHKRRGVAIVFNHEHFDKLRSRTGTDKDKKSLKRTLQNLGFDVRDYQDLKYDAVREVLDKVSAEDHTDNDCLLVAVMSHGEEKNLLFARDQAYTTSELWSKFTGNKCPSLLGKPKLFFIQACRGEGLDSGSRVVCDSVDAYISGYYIPNEADVLVMYSTVEGYYSWRNPTDGSWFIQALCKELDSRALDTDLLSMLTAVCRRVALYHQSCVPGDKLMDRKLQMPAIMSMLTRNLYFTPPKVSNATNMETPSSLY